jgi:hypothetical protein
VLIPEAALDDAIGFGGRRGIVALGLPDVGGNIGADVVVNQSRAGAQTLFQIDYRRKLLEFDVDIVERVLGDIAALGDHDHQRFADMADLVLREWHLRAFVENDAFDRGRRHQDRAGLPVGAEVACDVGGDHARPLQGLRNVDLQDFRMRYLAAQQSGMQHPRQLDVVDKQRLAGEKPAVFVALDRFAECASGHSGQPRIRIAAASTASTMFW